MPPRIRLRPRAAHLRITSASHHPLCAAYASLATAITPAPPIEPAIHAAAPVLRFPPTQPPSHKPPEVRKTQIHRQYQSLLKSSPLILLFQHNNVKAVEWMAIRRELAFALDKADAERAKSGTSPSDGSPSAAASIKLQVVQTGIFASALRVVEFFDPEHQSTKDPSPISGQAQQHPTDTNTAEAQQGAARLTHGLSRAAWRAASSRKLKLELLPLLSGPLALVAFPAVSPQHLATVLSILAPSPKFPAPKRRANPDYYEPAVQGGLQKLMFLGARVEGQVFDEEGARWVGGIDGGIDGLRAQLVHALQGAGMGLAGALEGASRSLYLTVEGRRMDMEDKEKGGNEA